MRLLLGRMARHRCILLFLPWAVALFVLVRYGGYLAFLRPEFRWLLYGGYLILLLLLTAELFRDEPARTGATLLFSPAILLVPILYLLNAQGAELDGYALRKRLLGPPRIGEQGSLSGSPSPSSSGPLSRDRSGAWVFRSAPRLGAPATDASGALVVTILDLHRTPEEFDGKLVSVVGMVMRSEDIRKEFGPGSFLAFRFRVTCCAADAQPFGVVTQAIPGQPDFPDNAWIEVRGRFELHASPGGKTPVIANATVSSTAAPERRYLY
jgi:uncharacterized repeat protein (TIGR03943 family)